MVRGGGREGAGSLGGLDRRETAKSERRRGTCCSQPSHPVARVRTPAGRGQTRNAKRARRLLYQKKQRHVCQCACRPGPRGERGRDGGGGPCWPLRPTPTSGSPLTPLPPPGRPQQSLSRGGGRPRPPPLAHPLPSPPQSPRAPPTKDRLSLPVDAREATLEKRGASPRHDHRRRPLRPRTNVRCWGWH